MRNVLAEKYGDQTRWVYWKLETRKGKTTKLPYDPETGRLASSTDPDTWGTLAQAQAKSPNVGIVFMPDQLLLGIDIDHCIEGIKIAHPQKKAIQELLRVADTYCELSPSKSGLHLYFSLTAPFKPVASRHEPFETYTDGRYFTVTNHPFGEIKDVRTITPDEAVELLSILGYPWREKPLPLTSKKPSKNLSPSVTDSEVLERMFSSKNGREVKALYDGDISQHENNTSAADMALLSHLAFWCAKDEAQMERLWLQSELGHRGKTRGRADYRRRTIDKAVDRCAEVFTPGYAKPEVRELDLLTVGEGRHKAVVMNTENIMRVLARHADFKGRIRYDAFKNVVELDIDKRLWHELEDNDPVILQTRISVLFPEFAKVTKVMVWDAIVAVSKDAIDSAADFICGLKWDGEARLDTWLSSTYGVPDDVYHRAVGSNWLKGMVKRVMQPGCKFDYVLVLEGRQDLKKSMSLNILASPAWYVETAMATDNKDFFMQFVGKALVEFSEGETLSRTETKRMKAIITMQTDRYRPSYGRSSVDFPRRCVFAMTTNQEEYLKDETGNRRWLPVAVEAVADVEWLAANRDQLLAEAYKRVIVDRETTWEFPKEETQAAQESRRIHDPNDTSVAEWYVNKATEFERQEGVTAIQVFQQALNSGFGGRLTRMEEMSTSDILKRVLKLDRRRALIGGVRSWRWYPTEKTPRQLTIDEVVAMDA